VRMEKSRNGPMFGKRSLTVHSSSRHQQKRVKGRVEVPWLLWSIQARFEVNLQIEEILHRMIMGTKLVNLYGNGVWKIWE